MPALQSAGPNDSRHVISGCCQAGNVMGVFQKASRHNKASDAAPQISGPSSVSDHLSRAGLHRSSQPFAEKVQFAATKTTHSILRAVPGQENRTRKYAGGVIRRGKAGAATRSRPLRSEWFRRRRIGQR